MKSVAQAGAVVYRIIDNRLEFLVQRSRKVPQRWGFPKGHIEENETAEGAAERELLEEAGIKGCNKGFLSEVEIVFREELLQIKYFLFEYITTVADPEKGRDPEWLCIDSAKERVSLDLYSRLIEIAVSTIYVDKGI